jgi:hypothetical protein
MIRKYLRKVLTALLCMVGNWSWLMGCLWLFQVQSRSLGVFIYPVLVIAVVGFGLMIYDIVVAVYYRADKDMPKRLVLYKEPIYWLFFLPMTVNSLLFLPPVFIYRYWKYKL